VVPPKEGFLEALRESTQRYGIVLIFDEVITGFRLALGGAQEYYGVEPDVTTLGKILGGGFPIAAYAGREEIMRMIAPSGKVYQAGTFSGNPVSVVAGLAILKFLSSKRQSFYSEMESKCRSIVEPLKAEINDSGLKMKINHIASMFQLFFTETPVQDYASVKTADNKKYMEFHRKLLQQGIFLPPSQFETCFVSKAHCAEDITRTVQSFKHTIK
jgi:glutamate-1-semialdehyde 2,1-aminomutase